MAQTSAVHSHTNGNIATSHKQIMVFDMMRLRSHLFFRFMCTNPTIEPVYHPWIMSNLFGPERITLHFLDSPAVKDWNDGYESIRTIQNTYAGDTKELERAVEEVAQKGKIALINEHCHWVVRQDIVIDMMYKGKTYTHEDVGTNPTRLPDWIFETMTPVILIRHPVLYVQSEYVVALAAIPWRPGDKGFSTICSMRFSRLLFDSLRAHGRQPIVVDGEDLLWRTQELSTGLCEKLSLQPGSLKDSWEPMEGHADPLLKAYTSTIFESQGIQKPEGNNVSAFQLIDKTQY